MEIKAKYVKPDHHIAGIPARDLTVDDWNELTEEQRTAAIASGLYEIVIAPATEPAKE